MDIKEKNNWTIAPYLLTKGDHPLRGKSLFGRHPQRPMLVFLDYIQTTCISMYLVQIEKKTSHAVSQTFLSTISDFIFGETGRWILT